MSDYRSPLTFQELDEFGDPRTKLSDFVNLVKLDPIINIIRSSLSTKKHTFFPNVVIEIGINDPRTEPSESLRWIAYARKYRSRFSCNNRKNQIIINIDQNTGHSSNHNNYIEAEKNARSLHFILSHIPV
jgi:protease II